MDAKDNPVVRGRRSKEISNQDFGPIERKINLQTFENEPIAALTESDAGALLDEAEYMKELAFMEEPVSILIQPHNQDNAPTTVQCWVNGKGAEHFRNGKWMICGWLPIGVEVTTKRKYVEVIARSRRDHISTDTNNTEGMPDGGRIRKRSTSEIVFSITHDANPRGREWATKIFSGL